MTEYSWAATLLSVVRALGIGCQGYRNFPGSARLLETTAISWQRAGDIFSGRTNVRYAPGAC